jgi:hypothetical protein
VTLYNAEKEWRNNDPYAGMTVSPSSVFGLTAEVIHHRVFDHIPGIEQARAEFTPEKVKQHTPGSEFELPEHMQAGVSDEGHLVFKPHALRVGAITHEAAHLITRLGPQFDAHGEEFARNHLLAVHNTVDKSSAEQLGQAYDRFNVPYRKGVR